MKVEVVVLAEGGNEELCRRWTVEGRSRVPSPDWRNLALELVRRWRRGLTRGCEVYLCHRAERAGELYDHDFLEALVTHCHDHSWGASVHIVLDNRKWLEEGAADWHDAREAWLRTALRSGVAGLIQVKLDPNVPADPILLRDARERARDMAETVPVPADGWSVVLLGSAEQREECSEFLAPFIRSRGVASELLLVIADQGETSPQVFVEQELARLAPARATVATAGVQQEHRLHEYCVTKGLDLLRFRGLHELEFFLLRGASAEVRGPQGPPARGRPERSFLPHYDAGWREALRAIDQEHPSYSRAQHYARRLARNLDTSHREGESEESVAERRDLLERWNLLTLSVLGTSFARLCRRGGEKRGTSSAADLLLVTTSLDPATHEEECLVAARITGRLLPGLPPTVAPRIHLAVSRGTLSAIMDGMSIAGWIYLGLASGEPGLQEACSGDFVPPEAWLSFPGSSAGRLPFALLVAGTSAHAARSLAERGLAATAIGFKPPELSDRLAHPVRTVLDQLLQGNRDRWSLERILRSSQGEVFFAEVR